MHVLLAGAKPPKNATDQASCETDAIIKEAQKPQAMRTEWSAKATCALMAQDNV